MKCGKSPAAARILILVITVLLLRDFAAAQTPDLIQAAKKEGEVIVFGSLENDVATAISKFVQMISFGADEYAKKREEYRQIFRR